MKFAVLLALASTLAGATSDQPKQITPRLPALASVFPQGTQPGSKLQVEILGEYLDRALSVHFLDPAIEGRVVDSSYTRLALEFEVKPDASLGPHYFRVITPRGASNILLFRIGDQPHVLEKEPNSTFEQAQEVTLPVTINGRLNEDGDTDFFKFHVEKGQGWIFDLRSARNGNGLDPALILLDARGRKLAHSEDVFIWDPFIYHQFTETGEYYAVVQPTHRYLDPTFAYQLEIRTAPHLEAVSPISMQPAATQDATVFGVGLNGTGAKLWFDSPGFEGQVLEMRGSNARIRIQVPADAPEGPRQLAIVTAGGRSSPATFLVDHTPVHTGGEHIAPPVSINGIARYRQPERFSFDVKDNEKLVFEVRGSRFGSPVDSVLRILDEHGEQIAKNDDGEFPGEQYNKDSLLAHTFAKAGRYQVEIRNLVKPTGEDYPYQLVVRPPKPGFQLMLDSDNPYVYAGGEGSVKITAVRQDEYAGAIPLQVHGLAPGITAKPLEIKAGADEAELHFTAKELKPGTYSHIRVLAPQNALPAWRTVKISSGGGEGETFAKVLEATLAVVERPSFSLEAATETVHLVRGGSAEFQVMIQGGEKFQEPVGFSFENLPPGVTAGEPTSIEPEHVTLHLTASKDARAGRFARVAILGRTKSGEVQEAPKIEIAID